MWPDKNCEEEDSGNTGPWQYDRRAVWMLKIIQGQISGKGPKNARDRSFQLNFQLGGRYEVWKVPSNFVRFVRCENENAMQNPRIWRHIYYWRLGGRVADKSAVSTRLFPSKLRESWRTKIYSCSFIQLMKRYKGNGRDLYFYQRHWQYFSLAIRRKVPCRTYQRALLRAWMCPFLFARFINAKRGPLVNWTPFEFADRHL